MVVSLLDRGAWVAANTMSERGSPHGRMICVLLSA